MMNTHLQRAKNRLKFIYKEKYTACFYQRFIDTIEKYKRNSKEGVLWDQRDVFLITYGDSIKKTAEMPLQTLYGFINKYLKDSISIVHILPFFPYSSDDGFSVIDFEQVDSSLGTWQDIQTMASEYKMMADLVVNHISAKSEWMQQFIDAEAPGKNYILTVDEAFDTSEVVRPRSSDLLTIFRTKQGEKQVWTTFSADQIDLNYQNPDLLLEMIEILLGYVEKGITVIRLDAIAFLWKKSGTSCLHLPETHEIVKLMRDVLDYCAPGTILLTETNVPHKENISYFGNGDEAHMVYQFALPPLLLHALHTGDSTYLTQWASTLENPGAKMTYFNFTASHDGIGVRPLEGLLPDDEKQALFEKMLEFGGKINTRRTVEGKNIAYELNITYYDALKGTSLGQDGFQIQRFVASQTIMMSLQGIPAVYIHSLLGTHNYPEGVAQTGQNRTINRRKWDWDEITGLITKEGLAHNEIFTALTARLRLRRQQQAFHPSATQEIIDKGGAFFVILRRMGDAEILVVANLTNERQELNFPESEKYNRDILSPGNINPGNIELNPYQIRWLIKTRNGI